MNPYLNHLIVRLRDYSPENRQHVVHAAADEIERLVRETSEARDEIGRLSKALAAIAGTSKCALQCGGEWCDGMDIAQKALMRQGPKPT